jgi:hypothetical protein
MSQILNNIGFKSHYETYNLILNQFFDTFYALYSVIAIVIVFALIAYFLSRIIKEKIVSKIAWKPKNVNILLIITIIVVLGLLTTYSYLNFGLAKDHYVRNLFYIGLMLPFAIIGLNIGEKKLDFPLMISIIIVSILNLIIDKWGTTRYLFYLLFILPILGAYGYKTIFDFFMRKKSIFIRPLRFTIPIGLALVGLAAGITNIFFIPDIAITPAEIQMLNYMDDNIKGKYILGPSYEFRVESYSDNYEIGYLVYKKSARESRWIAEVYKNATFEDLYLDDIYIIQSYRTYRSIDAENEGAFNTKTLNLIYSNDDNTRLYSKN